MSKRASENLPKALAKVPKLMEAPSYQTFMKEVIKVPENKKILAINGKELIDAEYKRLLDARYDEGKASELFREATSSHNIAQWKGWFSRQFPNAATQAASRRTSGLVLPKVGSDPRNSGNDFWRFQTYAEFAIKAQKKNPSVSFDKELMDEAFTAAVGMANWRKQFIAAKETMLTRCLGKESKEYWEFIER